jgi:Protein of unknown function DUF262
MTQPDQPEREKIEDLGEEDESDLVHLESPETLEAVVASTDWTAETLLSQIRRGNIQLDPEFQRRDAWSRSRKSQFIESLVVGIPVPQIVLATRKDERGSYLVLDGKQRLLTMGQFASAEVEQPLKLVGLKLRPDLNGHTYESLPTPDRNEFDNQTIRTVVVRNWTSDNFLFAVFLRLNTGNLPLSPQELRQALHPGPFVRFVNEFTQRSEPFKAMLNLRDPDFRMRDVELLVRFFAFDYFLPRYTGNLKPFLDGACETLNAQWTSLSTEIEDRASACETAIMTTLEVFGDAAFRRWNQEAYERPFNRAVYDVMTYYFKGPAIAKAAVANRNAVVAEFQAACDEPDFAEALTTTTKSIEAIERRLRRWGQGLHSALGIDARAPQLLDGRIEYAV